MPGPLLNTKPLPGSPSQTLRDSLPASVNQLLEFLYPADQIMPEPMPGMGMIAKAPKSAGIEVIKRLRTLPTLSGFSPDAVNYATRLYSKYPRLFAHLGEVSTHPPSSFKDLAGSNLGETVGHAQGATISGYRPKGFTDISILQGRFGEGAAKTLAHELTHAAQNLRQPNDFWNKYSRASQLLGYENNPYEERARSAGQKFWEYIQSGRTR